MVLESASDLAGYFDTSAHGTSATITINGSSSSINVILNKEYFAIDPGMGIDVDGTQPVVTGRSSDMSGVDNADTILIDSITYNIVDVQPDGVGCTALVLEEQ
ncbi:MAG: putative head-tail joining protein [Prokaryotic dsDNA virus sp.]|jgi:hypothetical protein|nr:MAG: putative head-tail joining protein [Prokaryotic dsDNA virus sp.]|tara:strand:- start:17952 stop:18260 length:309 start_codon:yes stop_codon:yes gene_type:complete